MRRSTGWTHLLVDPNRIFQAIVQLVDPCEGNPSGRLLRPGSGCALLKVFDELLQVSIALAT
jgi:hypothetical protein